jgi:hypothetical protein
VKGKLRMYLERIGLGFRRGKVASDTIVMPRIISERTLDMEDEFVCVLHRPAEASDRVNCTKLM